MGLSALRSRNYLVAEPGQPGPEVINHHGKAFPERHHWFPPKKGLRFCDIRLSPVGVVTRVLHKDNVCFGVDNLLHQLGKLKHGELTRVAEVDRPHNFIVVHHLHHARDEIRDELKRPRLLPIAIDCEVLPEERLADKVADDATIIERHPRSVCVEDSDNTDLNPIGPPVVKGKGLCHALALIVTCALAYGVDVAPVALRLWMLQRVPIDL
mmetsp:Transcript_19501/g.46566  ORF Transcript_19501/g.46566 Transcript_19501/m.46566 type:complete len:211 (+) Transcript_19501:209-841(+)